MDELFDCSADRTRVRSFVQYLVTFYSRPETASEVISDRFVGSIVADKPVKFCHPRLNRSRGILPEAVGGGIFDGFQDNL